MRSVELLLFLAAGVPLAFAALIAIFIAAGRWRGATAPAALVIGAALASLAAFAISRLNWLLTTGSIAGITLPAAAANGISIWATILGALSFALLALAVLVATRSH